MKMFAFIMGCWMLFLAGLPCGDRPDDGIATQTTIAAATGNHRHQCDQENCPPFCTCACCTVLAAPQTPFAYTLSKHGLVKTTYNSYTAFLATAIPFAVWQPPKSIS